MSNLWTRFVPLLEAYTRDGAVFPSAAANRRKTVKGYKLDAAPLRHTGKSCFCHLRYHVTYVFTTNQSKPRANGSGAVPSARDSVRRTTTNGKGTASRRHTMRTEEMRGRRVRNSSAPAVLLPPRSAWAQGLAPAFTLVEVVFSIAIMALVFCGMVLTYVQTSYQAEWSGYSLAAQSLSLTQLEQARSAVWDSSIGKNEITNLCLTNVTYNAGTKTSAGYTWAILDLPVSGTNTVKATNYVTIRTLYVNGVTNPPVQLQMVTVDTVWPFTMFGRKYLCTNRTASLYGMDNRDNSSL